MSKDKGKVGVKEPEPKQQETIRAAKELAQRAIDGELPLLLACVKMMKFVRALNGLDNEIRLTLTGISSECDGLPLGDERQYWDQSALEKADIEIDLYTELVKANLIGCFRQIAAL